MEADVADGGAFVCVLDLEAYEPGGDGWEFCGPVPPDVGSFVECGPVAVFAVLELECGDALPEGFVDHHYIEGDGVGEFDFQPGLGDAVVGGPAASGVVVDGSRGDVAWFVAADVGCAGECAWGNAYVCWFGRYVAGGAVECEGDYCDGGRLFRWRGPRGS